METAIFSRRLIVYSMALLVCSVSMLAMILTATAASPDILNETGRIAGFEPIQLTKHQNGNAIWNEDDVEKMRQRLLGRSISQTVNFDPEVDAVTSATITSAVIFHALSQGKKIFQSVVK